MPLSPCRLSEKRNMRRLLIWALLALFSTGTASAGWFGDGSPESRQDSVSTFKQDVSKAFGSGKLVAKEKIAEAKEKAKEVEQKTQKSAKDAAKKVAEAKAKAKKIEQKAQKSAKEAAIKIRKTRDDAVEEGKGLIGDIKMRYGRAFKKTE